MLRRSPPALVLSLVLLVACSGSDGTGSTGPDESANSAPTASLTHSPSNPETGEAVTLDASASSDPDGSIAEYRWDVDGDGSVDATTSGATRDHTYGSTGEKTPSVTVADADGATAEASTSVQVVSANSAPTASLTHSPSNPETGEAVTLDASASSDPDGSIAEYRWDVDGDGSVDATTSGATYGHAYGSTGEKTPSVTVADDAGATAEAADTVQVMSANTAPTASLTHSPSNPETGETVTFDASGSSDPDGDVVEYRWDVDGDGTVDDITTISTYSHAYGSAGDRTAVVTVADNEGAEAQAQSTVQVVSGNTAPTAALTHSPTNPSVGETVTFDASGSSDPDGDVVEYRWDVDGDGTVDDITTISTYSHAYGSGGDYTARVTVVDNEGAEAQAQSTVQVASGNTAPTADLTHSPTNPSVGETVTFDASGSSDPDGSIVEYRWDFDGDGTVDNVTTISTYSHAYGSSGDYGATVTVYDEDGASDLATTTVQVN